RYFACKLHIYLETTVQYLGIHLPDPQRIRAAGQRELPFQVGVDTRNVMLIDVGPHLKTGEHVDLSEPLARIFILPDLSVKGRQLSVDRRTYDEVVDLSSHERQCAARPFVGLPAL